MRSPWGVGAGFAIFKFFVGGTFRLSHGTMIIESVAAAETRQAASLRRGFSVASCFHGLLLICRVRHRFRATFSRQPRQVRKEATDLRSEEHTSELQSHLNLVCRLLLEKKKTPHSSLC